MAVANVKRPEVVRYGGAYEQRFTYVNSDTLALAIGDLVRITTAGTVEVALASAAGAVSGMALEAAVVDAEVSILLFADDTVLSMSAIDAVAPTTLKKSVAYTLELGTAPNEFGVTATSGATGIAIVVDYADTGNPWSDTTGTYDNDSTAVGGTVLVRFGAATLDGSAAVA
jgi:hypothetical protein